ncbi:MAG: right-handed parallel beta-helix repeat-containing protein, partial [Planctomycetota bacterium]
MRKAPFLPGCGVGVAALLVPAMACAGSVVFVDDDAAPGGDGLSWSTAYRFLQDALALAADPGQGITELHVAGGTYRPDRDEANPGGTGDRTMSFMLIDGVSLQGGYAGIGAPDPDARDIVLFETVLSGDLAGDDGAGFENNGDNSYHVVFADRNDETAALDGFTITAGNADGPEDDQQRGGGMFDDFGTPAISNCTFRDNAAHLDGGGLCLSASESIVSECRFVGNFAGWYGGGLCNLYFEPTVVGCAFDGNMALHHGGGAYSDNGQVIMSDCTFDANLALDNGGGFYGEGALTDCTFTENLAGNDAGGAQFWWGSTVANCVFAGNVADVGGAIYQDHLAEFDGCSFIANVADRGGALYCATNLVSLINCTFEENLAAEDGAGIYIDAASPTLTTCTFTANVAESFGGGVYVNGDAAPTFSGCAFNANTASSGGGMYGYTSHPVIQACTFAQNIVPNSGGGLLIHTAAGAVVSDCVFEWNEARNGSGMASYNSSLTMTGCILRNNGRDNLGNSDGGGLTVRGDGPAVISNCQFIDNAIGDYGGGLRFDEATGEVTDCTFTGNLVRKSGAGLSIMECSPTVSDCIFDANTAGVGLISASGGGLSITDGSPLVSGCTFTDNVAGDSPGAIAGGGGLAVGSSGAPTIRACTFTGNYSTQQGGGASISSDSLAVIDDCDFAFNMAERRGGGLYVAADAAPSIINCTLVENSALQVGGGVCIRDAVPVLFGCTITGNTSGLGGGVYIYDDSAGTIINGTIVGNEADEGGGIYLACSGPGHVLTNSILRGNSALIAAPNLVGRPYASNSNVEGGYPGPGNVDADPLFVDPDGPDNYPGTYLDNDYRLLGTSPCIDAGDSTAVPEDGAELDAAGNPRMVDDAGTCDTGTPDGPAAVVDIGAYEFQETSPVIDCNETGVTDQCDIVLGLSQDCNGNAVPDECDIAGGASP